MGMLVDKTDLGFGSVPELLDGQGRGDREDVHRAREGRRPFEVSDADTMLNINPKAKKRPVAILTREGCGYCAKAKALLKGWAMYSG